MHDKQDLSAVYLETGHPAALSAGRKKSYFSAHIFVALALISMIVSFAGLVALQVCLGEHRTEYPARLPLS